VDVDPPAHRSAGLTAVSEHVNLVDSNAPCEALDHVPHVLAQRTPVGRIRGGNGKSESHQGTPSSRTAFGDSTQPVRLRQCRFVPANRKHWTRSDLTSRP